MLVARRGIAAAWEGWGQAVQANGGSARFTLDADVYSRQVHYMTDNGAYYCFCNIATTRIKANDIWRDFT